MTSGRGKKKDGTGHTDRQIVLCPWREEEEEGEVVGRRGEGGGRGCRLELLDVVQKDGVFSTLYRCRDSNTHRQYLIKKVHLGRLDDRDVRYRLREIPIWTHLRHRHILTCLHGWQSGADLWLLSEAASDTVERVVMEKGQPPPEALFQNWLYQLASALQYLHEFQDKPILHRNLKPSNIMVVPHYVLKISDFGFSKELQDIDAMARSCVGTANIMSPEMVNKEPYSAKTDMWSLGITAVFIATLQDAIMANTYDTVFRKTSRGQVRGIAGQYSPGTEDLVHSLLQVDPLLRPSASQFLTDLRLCSKHCATPADAGSYPGRQMVPQKNPVNRQGSRSGQRSAAARQGHESLPQARGGGLKKTTQPPPPAAASPEDGLPGTPTSKKTSKPSARKERTAGSQRTPSLLSRDKAAHTESPIAGEVVASNQRRAGEHPTPSAESLSLSILCTILDKTNRASRAGSARGQGRDHNSRRCVRDAGRETRRPQVVAAAPGAAAAAASSEPIDIVSSGARAVQRSDSRSSRRGKAVSDNGMTKSPKGKAPREDTVSLAEPETPKGRRTQDVVDLPASDRRSGRGRQGTGERTAEDVLLLQGLGNLELGDLGNTDTFTTNPQMINTFPGAFNVDRLLPPVAHDFSTQHTPAEEDGSRSPARPRHRSECELAPRDRGGSGRWNDGQADTTSGYAHTSFLFDAPESSWPQHMREYWVIANDLVTRMGADTFFTALKYARLFSESEVQWLREKGMVSAGQCMDSLKRLLALDSQLDDDTLFAFNDTLRRLPHAGDEPA
ncbi:uncharacterized protein LOC143281616 isoform X2 [Babylonia areolata]|uniref:uncharacterized protein LOC143281616 isoform X2 n=1 Tax=Babylonia areolata TaxID=304850 RepID=UPI003FD37FA2